MNNSYIKLYRCLLDWEWYKDNNTKVLFIHLLLTANFIKGRFQGVDVERGQLITGLYSLGKSTGLGVQSLRTSLNKLKSTGEITIKTTNKYSVITIIKYEEFQSYDKKPTSKSTSKLTNEQQTTNKQLTTIEESNNIINIPFETFWNLYNKKKAVDVCKKKWHSLNDDDRQLIIKTLPMFLSEIKDKQFQPHPATYLNQKRWFDEQVVVKEQTPERKRLIELSKLGLNQ